MSGPIVRYARVEGTPSPEGVITIYNPDTALLSAVRAWFAVWAANTERLSPGAAVCLPEFKPLLAAMVDDYDARHPADLFSGGAV